MTSQAELPSFFTRLALAFSCFFKILFDAAFAQKLQLLPLALPAPAPAASPAPTADLHSSGLVLLGMLQREGRFIDFIQEDVAAFSDAEVGGAARVVHEGCRRLVRQYLTLAPAIEQDEGASLTVPPGFDATRIRLAGNVTGQPPFNGTVRHRGWVVSDVRLPTPAAGIDPHVLAPADVEL